MLVEELHSHDQTINLLLENGRKLTNENHYASAEIQAGIDKLNNSWKALTEQAQERSCKLSESLRLQQVQFNKYEIFCTAVYSIMQKQVRLSLG